MKTKRFCKSTVSLLLVFMMLISMLTVGIVSTSAAEADVAETGDTIPGGIRLWLKPNTNWKTAGRIACYFYNDNSNVWHSAYYDEYHEAYYVTAPTSFNATGLNWCRMNSSNTTNSWDNKWDETGGLGYSASYGNCWNITEDQNAWSNAGGSWSNINSYYLSGSFNNWSEGNDARFEQTNSTTFVKTLELTQGTTYTFKIKGDGGDNQWYSNTGTYNDEGLDWTFTPETDVSKNCTIIPKTTGTYTFTLVITDTEKKLSVASPTTGGGESGGGDSGDTTGDTTYYFGLAHVTLESIKYSGTGVTTTTKTSSDLSLVEENKEFTLTTENDGDQKITFNMYSLDIPSAATTVEVIFKKDNDSETQTYTLNSEKAILMFHYSSLQSQQIAYSYSGGGSGDSGAHEGVVGDGNITGGTVFYLDPTDGWESSGAYFVARFTGTTTTDVALVTGEECADGIFRAEAPYPGPWTSVQWLRCKPTDGSVWNVSSVHDEDNNFCTINDWDNNSTWSTYTGDDSFKEERESATRIQFIDTTGTVASDDAKLFMVDSNNTVYEMTKSVEVRTGLDLWYAELSTPADTTATFTFYRTSVFADKDNLLAGSADNGSWWKKWTTVARDKNVTFLAQENTGAWSSTKYRVPESLSDYTHGVWVDTKGVGNTADVVAWHHVEENTYHLYLPSYTNLNALNLYTSFDNATITGGYYSEHDLVSFSKNTLKMRSGTSKYTIQYGATSYTLYIYKSANASTMFMNTERELYTGKISTAFNDANAWPKDGQVTGEDNIVQEYKEAIETSGTYAFYNVNGSKVNADNGLKEISGRGFSTFKSSMYNYGKYPYNFKLDSAVSLIDGSAAADKWCLIANNVDQTMLRNTLIYSLADDIGLKYAADTQLVDVYDNGKYLGAYILTEKVDYGEGTLMSDLKNLDDRNKEINPSVDFDALTQTESTYKATTGTDYTYSYTGGINTPSDYKDYNFVLEFELQDRYEFEPSWFKSSLTGQAVVVKYPEIATDEEMQWIIEQYEAVEQAVYSDNYNEYSKLIDVDSFAKVYLLQELSLNLDAGATSYFIYNDPSGKLAAAPVWDYDWTMGSYYATKPIVGGTSSTLDDPEQMFAKNKSMKTDSGVQLEDTYNLQAKLAQNTNFWTQCQLLYTNVLMPALDNYIYNLTTEGTTGYDNNDILLYKWMPQFKDSVTMNHARWNTLSSTPLDEWGTKSTTGYASFTNTSMSGKDFNIGQNNAGSAPATYKNSVYYLNDWLARRWNYLSSSSEGKGNLYLEEQRYNFESDLTFSYTQNGQLVSIHPSVSVTLNDAPVASSDVAIVVYINDKPYQTTFTLADSIQLELEGGNYDIRLEAYPKAFSQLVEVSDTVNVNVTFAGSPVKVNVYFKSSDSYRYTPSVTFGDTTVEMEKSGDAIGMNDAEAQGYYWYVATVDAIWGEDLTVTFTNLLKMDAEITISNIERESIYIGVDNLNNGTTAVDLTDKAEGIRNFTKTAVHMVANNEEENGLAQTSLKGRMYVMGDANVDGNLSIMDATEIQLALVGKKELNEVTEQLADFDLNEVVSISDVTAIQVYLVQ